MKQHHASRCYYEVEGPHVDHCPEWRKLVDSYHDLHHKIQAFYVSIGVLEEDEMG
jgi:hypothetical protein